MNHNNTLLSQLTDRNVQLFECINLKEKQYKYRENIVRYHCNSYLVIITCQVGKLLIVFPCLHV